MATLSNPRLAPVTARDGVDTRKQDLTTRSGAGDRVQDGSDAALYYMIPPDADVPGSAMSSYWGNYMSTANRYIRREDESFMWTSFVTQQSANECDIQRERASKGAGAEMLNVFRQFYNASITEFHRTHASSNLKDALEWLDKYNDELSAQTAAAVKIQRAFRNVPMYGYIEDYEEAGVQCPDCEEYSLFLNRGLCMCCYYEVPTMCVY